MLMLQQLLLGVATKAHKVPVLQQLRGCCNDCIGVATIVVGVVAIDKMLISQKYDLVGCCDILRKTYVDIMMPHIKNLKYPLHIFSVVGVITTTHGFATINILTHFSKINAKYVIYLIFNHNSEEILNKYNGKHFGSKSHT
jgi:hypothetical protein